MRSLILLFSVSMLPVVQSPAEPTVSKEAISVHQVRRGTMPLREMASGSITSTDPPRAMVSLPRTSADSLRVGQTASIQINPPKVISGRVAQIDKSGLGEAITATVELDGQVPDGGSIGTRVHGSIDVGELPDVVFLERPGDSRPYADATIFLLEPDGEHARRVKVRYGRQSGSLMEITSGLSPGDRVIVTALPGSTGYDRVRLE